MAYNQANTAEEMISQQTPSISFNKMFFKSSPGILKLIEIVVDIIIWICVGSGMSFGTTRNGGYINFAATITFIFTFLLFIFYLFQIIYRLPGPWILIESLSIILSIFLLLIALLVAGISHQHGPPAIAAAVFCAVNAAVYGVEFFMRFRISRGPGWAITASAVDGDVILKSSGGSGSAGGAGGPGGQGGMSGVGDMEGGGGAGGPGGMDSAPHKADPYAVP